jgi:hypothetical protein
VQHCAAGMPMTPPHCITHCLLRPLALADRRREQRANGAVTDALLQGLCACTSIICFIPHGLERLWILVSRVC